MDITFGPVEELETDTIAFWARSKEPFIKIFCESTVEMRMENGFGIEPLTDDKLSYLQSMFRQQIEQRVSNGAPLVGYLTWKSTGLEFRLPPKRQQQ